MFSLVQLFTFGLAALTARNGFQVSTTSNVGVSRVAGQALMAFAAPALAVPLENVNLVARNETSAPGGEDCDEDDEDVSTSALRLPHLQLPGDVLQTTVSATDVQQDSQDDEADDEDDSQDDEADDADDGADDEDDSKDDEGDDEDDSKDDEDDSKDDGADDEDDSKDDEDDSKDDEDDEEDDEEDDSKDDEKP